MYKTKFAIQANLKDVKKRFLAKICFQDLKVTTVIASN